MTVRGASEIKTVLGIDPGGTTGVALIDVPTVGLIVATELSTVDVLTSLRWYVQQADLVSIERFTISTRTLKLTRQPDALYIIGITTLLCHEEGVPLELESPANAKTAFNDVKLVQYGLKQRGSKHTNDAVRHALLAMRRHRILPERV